MRWLKLIGLLLSTFVIVVLSLPNERSNVPYDYDKKKDTLVRDTILGMNNDTDVTIWILPKSVFDSVQSDTVFTQYYSDTLPDLKIPM